MKEKLHCILIVANAISIILILQIVFEAIPLIECSFNQHQISQINNLILDISIGVLLSSLFYYLLVYVPGKRKLKVVRQINHVNLIRIANWMQLIIGYVSERCSLGVEGDFYKKIKSAEFDKVTRIGVGDGVNYCKYEETIRERQYSFGEYIDTIHLQINKENTIKFIEEITSSPTIIYEDEELVAILSKIKKCLFFIFIDEIKTQVNSKNYNYTPFKSETICEFHQLYISLLKYVTPYPIVITAIE
ncbi:hypothetical protein [Bacteroides sp.]|uniref:hypothetical protein n=1 Tax=Bacteroides sp. TaxID=29523 RepID=UPI00260F341F|nr:hypothetical protein [Bacteroides sp.]MDD3038834.1 hypothetical protein [Bacteroides sp.]